MKIEKSIMILLVLILSMSITLGVVSAEAIDDSSVYGTNSDLSDIYVGSLNSNEDNISLESDVSSLNDDIKNYYVSDINGDDANDGLSKETAVKTISKAYSMSEDGSIIYIGSGVYYSTSSLTVNKSVSFIGDGDAVINKSSAASFAVPYDSVATVVFKNLNFINEVVSSGNPIIQVQGDSDVTISDCKFTNIATGKNGMVKFLGNAVGLIENCTFANSSSTGGSNSYILAMGNAVLTVSKTQFINLTANGYLRAIAYVNAETATLNLNEVLFDSISGDMYGVVENKGKVNLNNVVFSNSKLSGSYSNSLITSSETNAAKSSSTTVNHTLFMNNSVVADISCKGCPVTVEYSSFLDNNKAIMNNVASVSANYNWYGTNKKENINVENVTIDNWAILTVDPSSASISKGDKLLINAYVNKYESTDGSIKDLADTIPISASFAAVSGELDYESDYGDSEASSEYSATVEGNDVITVTSGSESIEIPVTVSGSTPSEIVITDDNYADYFDLANNGTIKADCGIVDGTTVYIANVTNKVFTFDKSVNVVGVEGSKISNGYVHLVGGASGSNLTGLTIINDVVSISNGVSSVSLHGIWLSNVENCTISNNFVQTSPERTVFAMPLTNASYNVIANNTIIGGASTCMPMGASSNNIISDNYLSTVGANIIYYNPYGHADYSTAKYKGMFNDNNTISNNVLNGTTGTMSSWCYAIQLMTGRNATIVNNTITNAFLGISLPASANTTVRGNKLSNIGSIAITVGSDGVEIADNVIDVDKTAISVSKAGLTISGNQINTKGVGINVTGGGNEIIENNNITTSAPYAIDLMSTSGNIVADNYLVSADLTGDDAVKSTGENTIVDNGPKPVSNIVTNDTFFDFFDENGILKDGVPTDLIFQGEFANLNGNVSHIVINRPVSIVCEDVVLRNIGIHLVEGSSGSNLTGFSIISNASNGIWLSDSNYNHITNCSINLKGSGKFAMPLIRSSYNVIDNCDIFENGSSVLVLCYANFNNVTDCDIGSASSNVVYINCYDILDFKSGVNGTDYGYNNSFVNNNVHGVGTAFCIGFQIMGSDNEFINNTVSGTSSAFSSPAPNTWANYTNNRNYFEGNHVENCTAGFVLGSQNNTVVNNTVINSGSGVSASTPSVILGNNIICNGTNVGVKLTGSDITVENNTIVTDKGAGITSTKNNNIMVGNNVSTGAQYAITLGSGSGNVVTGNYLMAGSTKGDLSVSGTGVNTIEDNLPAIGIVTNDTFFNFFDENGILKDDVPTDLIFQGEFANLNGNVSHIVINRPVSIKGDKAVLNNMTMQFIDGADGSVVDKLTFINYIASYALIDLENVTEVVVSNNDFSSYGNSSRCVLLNNATNCEVLNNIMFMNSTAYNSRAVLVGGNSAFNKISNNNIKVADFNGIDINPYVGGGHDNLVFNNTITSIADVVSSWNYAIQLGGPNNTAMNNTIYHVFMGIFSATNGNESVIVGNNISDLTGSFSAGAGGNAGGCAISAGIKNIVENNTITDYDLINTGINTGVNCTVSGNTIISNATNSGINVNSGSVVLNNVINSNYTNSQLINSNYQNVIIANNTVTSSNGSAIKVKSSASGVSVVEGNVIVITEGSSPAIETTCSNIEICGNDITVASGVGISSTKDNNIMKDNNISTGAQYAITLGSGSGNVVTGNYLMAGSTKGDSSVSGTGVNTIENNLPAIGIVTNDTFFNFFDENGILKDDVPTDLIFKGEFEGLPGIVTITISKSVVMNGIDAVLKNISIMTSSDLTDGLLINNFTIINDINNAGIVILDPNVIVSNSTIKVNSDGTTDANAIYAYAADNLILTNNIVEFTAKNPKFTNSLLLIEESANVLVDGNGFIADVPSADIDWSKYPLTIVKSAGLIFTSCDGLTFTDNEVLVSNSTVGSGYNTIYGVNVKGGSDVEISNNEIRTSGHYAYSLVVAGYMDEEYESYDVEDFKVSDNVIIAEGIAYACGLNLEGPANGNVTGNDISAKATTVAYPVYGSGMSGALAADYSNNTIYGIANSVYGMELMGRAETVLDNNITVEGNFTIGIASTSGTSSSGLVVKRNNINVKGEGKGTPSSGDTISSENVGIKIVTTGSNRFATIEDNNISSTGKFAINLTSTKNNVVINNYLVANPTMGNQAVYGTGSNTVLNNTPSYSGIIYVSPDGDDFNIGSKDAPVATIAKAIELATAEGGSKHIILAEGNYKENKLDVTETNLTIEGAGIDKTIIDASGRNGEIFNSYLSNLELSNLTLANAVNNDMSGGAILSMGNLTLDTVKITNCVANDNNGGAIYAVGALEINNSIIANNTGKTGGAIYLDASALVGSDSSLVIKDSVFENNTAEGNAFGGGAIYMQKVDGKKSIENTSFVDNTAVAGGAIFMQQSEGKFNIVDSSFINNSAVGPSTNYGGGALNLIGSSYSTIGQVNVDGCIFENNTADNNTRGGGAVLDRNVDLSITNSIILNNNDGNATSVYRDTTPYAAGGKVSLTNDWWGTNDPKNLTNTKVDSWIVMTITGPTNVTIGDDITMAIALNKLNDGSDYTGVLPADYGTTIVVNGSELMNITIPKGQTATFGLNVNKTGDYLISAINPIDGVEEANITITVNPKVVPVDVTVDEVTVGSNVTGVVDGVVDGTVNAVIDGAVYNGTVVDGKFSIDASDLAVGNYSDVTMEFVSADGNARGNATVNLTVSPKVVPVDVTVDEVTVGSNVTGVVDGVVDGTVTAVIDGAVYNGTVVDGKFSIDASDLPVGNYSDVTMEFVSADGNTVGSTTINLSINKIASKFTNATNGTVYNGNYYKVTLKDAKGNVLVNKTVTITILGKTYNVTTDKNGVAKVKVAATNSQIGKNLKVTYKFAGDSTYAATSGSSTIKIAKTATKITKITKGAVKNHGYFYVKLTTKSGKTLANKVITMKSKNSGKTYKIKTNSKGIAKIDLWVKAKPLGKYYSFTFKYAGSAYYKACTATFKVKIV